MDCHVANAPRNDVGGALLAMTEVALLAMGKATSLRGRMPKQSRHA